MLQPDLRRGPDRRQSARGGRRETDKPPCRCQACTSGQRGQAVPSEPARIRLLNLARAGVGIRRAARLAKVSASTLQLVRNGQAVTICANIERAILEMRPSLAHGSTVNSYETRRLIAALKAEGYTANDIRQRFGVRRVRRGRVRVDNALRVKAAHQSAQG
jgi:hypothetical protein